MLKFRISLILLASVVSSLGGVAMSPRYEDVDFTLTTTDSARIVSSATTTSSTTSQRIYRVDTTAVLHTDKIIQAVTSGTWLSSSFTPTITTSGTQASWNPTLRSVVHNSDGRVTLYFSTPYLTKGITFSLATTGSSSISTFSNWITGSLGQHLYGQVDALIASSTISTCLPMFSTRNDTTATYVRNPACWVTADMTGISIWNSYGGTNMAGVAVSPRHVVFANHYHPTVGTTMRFVKADGTVVTRTLSSLQLAYDDIIIGKLDSDLPAGITFYKIPPSNLAHYSSDLNLYPIPTVTTDQQKRVYLSDVVWMGDSSGVNMMTYRVPSLASRAAYFHEAIGGDSGSPLFYLINGNLVLACCYYTALGADDISQYATQINSAMTTLGGGYQLTTVDLSGFPSF